MSTETYNGWANRETWAASLLLGNDAATYDHANRAARAAYDAATVAEGLGAEYLPNVQRADIADALECIAASMQAVALGYMDPGPAPFDRETARLWVLEVGSLWRVEWRDIADHYRADIAEVVAA